MKGRGLERGEGMGRIWGEEGRGVDGRVDFSIAGDSVGTTSICL